MKCEPSKKRAKTFSIWPGNPSLPWVGGSRLATAQQGPPESTGRFLCSQLRSERLARVGVPLADSLCPSGRINGASISFMEREEQLLSWRCVARELRGTA